MSQQVQPVSAEDVHPCPNDTAQSDKLLTTDEYLCDQAAFDMDTIWFSVVPILGFYVALAVLKVMAG